MTATTKPKRTRKTATKTAKPATRHTAEAEEPKYRIHLKPPVKIYTEANERFMALPLKERDRILKKAQSEMKEALAGVMTMHDYLTERRREAEHDA